MADFSGDKQGKVEQVNSPFDGVLGEETPAQREVREALMSRQVTLAPDAAEDALGKESAMSRFSANTGKPADPKAADQILNNGLAVVGATKADTSFKPPDVLDVVNNKTPSFTKRTRADGLAVA